MEEGFDRIIAMYPNAKLLGILPEHRYVISVFAYPKELREY